MWNESDLFPKAIQQSTCQVNSVTLIYLRPRSNLCFAVLCLLIAFYPLPHGANSGTNYDAWLKNKANLCI